MFYDEGWNAYINGEKFNGGNSADWRDGWRDCELATSKYGQQEYI